MVLIGLSWIVWWMLVKVFVVELLKAALVVGLLYIIVGLLLGERPFIKDRP